MKSILPSVLMNLMKEIEEAEEEENEESAGNTISNASYNLLLLINKVSVSEQSKSYHLEFISKFITSKNKWEVISSLRAYQAMVLGLFADFTIVDVESSISNIFGLFENNAIVNRAILDLLHVVVIKHP
jgi:hypothetical protein